MSDPNIQATTDRPYHHGHLREALINGALDLIAEKGVQGLTIRGLAEKVGVSHAAPQYHFPDKAALLTAVATAGFGKLADAMVESLSEPDPAKRLVAMGRAYMDFAFANPSQYRVMFATELVHEKMHSEEFLNTASRALATLMEVVAELRGGTEAEVKKAAFFAWSGVHGAVMLHLDGTFPSGEHCPPEVEAKFGAPMEDLLQGVLDMIQKALA